jgi:ribonuclease VapC
VIVVDASALIAILDEEPDAVLYAEAIADADAPLVSAATVVEAGIVMFNRHGASGSRKLNALIREAGLEVESVTAQHAQIALQAYASYGKDRRMWHV